MEVLFRDFQSANSEQSGPDLAATISPIAPPNYLNRLDAIYKDSNVATISRDAAFGLTKSAHAAIQYPNPEIDTWTEIYSAYWYAVGAILAAEHAEQNVSQPDWLRVYMAWKDLSNTIIKGYSSGVLENWTLPVLYMAGKHLRTFAIKADESAGSNGNAIYNSGDLQEDIAGDFDRNKNLEDAARVINRMFTLCISDRAPLEESRKWGLYYMANLQFKTYFKLNSISLCKNVLRAISAGTTDMPDLNVFPKSHIVTFKYYVGVIKFLEEDYAAAEENLLSALHMCHRSATRNVELILAYLVPTRLLTSQLLPSPELLSPYPRLSHLFTPLVYAIRSGSLSDFDAALTEAEPEFVKRRIYLTLERGRDICLRNLLRKVYLASGLDEEGKRRTRIRVDEFGTAIRLGERGVDGESLENDEVECLVANMIYKVRNPCSLNAVFFSPRSPPLLPRHAHPAFPKALRVPHRQHQPREQLDGTPPSILPPSSLLHHQGKNGQTNLPPRTSSKATSPAPTAWSSSPKPAPSQAPAYESSSPSTHTNPVRHTTTSINITKPLRTKAPINLAAYLGAHWKYLTR